MTTTPRIPDRITCPDCEGHGDAYDPRVATAEYDPAACYTCGGIGTLPNPQVDMHLIVAAIREHSIPATLYMSGGNVATIGIGPITNDDDYTYLAGPGYYPDATAHRDELTAGPNDDELNANPIYSVAIGDEETPTEYGHRIANAYRSYCITIGRNVYTGAPETPQPLRAH